MIETGGCMKPILGIVLLFVMNAPLLLISEELPLVYDKEDTGAEVRKPAMPAFSDLPSIPYLPDPFRKADGKRITKNKEWRMGAEAARVDALAAREVWKALGIPDRMGATEENISHCTWHPNFTADLEAYLDRFLLGKTDGKSTDILRSKYNNIEREKWIPWTTPKLK
jgi:hypothetical protein